MDKNSTVKSRAYQMVSGNYILPEIFPLAFAEGDLFFLNWDDCETPSQYYEAIKAQCQLIEEIFESLEDLDESAEATDDGWSFATDHSVVKREFAEVWEGVTDDYLFPFFYESVAEEFARRPKEYGKYQLDEVVEAHKSQYTLIPDEKEGGYWKRVPQVEAAPVRATSAIEDPWAPLEDNEHY